MWLNFFKKKEKSIITTLFSSSVLFLASWYYNFLENSLYGAAVIVMAHPNDSFSAKLFYYYLKRAFKLYEQKKNVLGWPPP